eukprot:1159969-Pelagomonas_calceolata.AAC.1
MAAPVALARHTPKRSNKPVGVSSGPTPPCRCAQAEGETAPLNAAFAFIRQPSPGAPTIAHTELAHRYHPSALARSYHLSALAPVTLDTHSSNIRQQLLLGTRTCARACTLTYTSSHQRDRQTVPPKSSRTCALRARLGGPASMGGPSSPAAAIPPGISGAASTPAGRLLPGCCGCGLSPGAGMRVPIWSGAMDGYRLTRSCCCCCCWRAAIAACACAQQQH